MIHATFWIFKINRSVGERRNNYKIYVDVSLKEFGPKLKFY